MVSSRFLLFRLLLEKLCSVLLHLLVILEGTDERMVLLVAQLEVQVALHLAQLRFLLQELHCRLESYVQFSNCFV